MREDQTMATSAGSTATAAVALLGIFVTAVVAVFGYLHTARVHRRERVAQELAEALRAVGDYQDFTFPRATSTSIQPRYAGWICRAHQRYPLTLDFHSAWLHVAAPPVAVLFDRLVKTVRIEVNPHVQAAWREPLITEDTGMNLGLGSIYVSPETDRLKGKCTELMRRYLEPSWRWPGRRPKQREYSQVSSK